MRAEKQLGLGQVRGVRGLRNGVQARRCVVVRSESFVSSLLLQFLPWEGSTKSRSTGPGKAKALLRSRNLTHPPIVHLLYRHRMHTQ